MSASTFFAQPLDKRPAVQFAPAPGFVDLGPGQPDPRLEPTPILASAAAEALGPGSSALAYGPECGPGALLDVLCDHTSRVDERAPSPHEVLVTAGASHALDLMCSHETLPGQTVLVEERTYDLARRLFADRGLRVVSIADGPAGIDLDDLSRKLVRCARDQSPAAFLYVVPTFHNPTGRVMSPAQRRDLLRVAGQHDLTIVEDDVYRELHYEAPPPPSLWSLNSDARVFRVASVSKWVAPGLRVGWIVMPPDAVERYATGGLLASGGGIAHFAATVLGVALADRSMDRHLERMRAALRGRRDAFVETLAERLPAGFEWLTPPGGYFLWLRVPAGFDFSALAREARRRQVGWYPAHRFGAQPGGAIRLAFSYYPPELLVEGAGRLAAACRAALDGQPR